MTILKELQNGVLTLKLNRPNVFNSFNREMAISLQEELKAAEQNNEVRAIILTGEGKAFCAGQDLAEATDPNGPALQTIVKDHYNPIIELIRSIEKPIIAGVNGVAAGAGANIALACDISIAKESASFIQAFSKIGLIPDSGGTFFLPRIIGAQKALALMMTGDKLSAKDAEKMNMIYKTVADEQFEEELYKFAFQIAKMPTKGLGLTKKAVNESFSNNLTEQLTLEEVLQTQAGQTFDFKEGVNAFLEKELLNLKDVNMKIVGVVGAGTMGIGIAQVAVQNDKKVVVVEANQEVLQKSKINLFKTFEKLVEKQKITLDQVKVYEDAMTFTTDFAELKEADLVIEAIIENLEVKHQVFSKLEEIVSESCVLASNTSSLSIASISSALKKPDRFIGIHFFNPAPLMALVEIIPGVQTSSEVTELAKNEILSWNKKAVLVKDTPGFIVNRVARPFYGEALRIYEEGIADFATIDWAMTHFGGFKMGPFTLMDYIGNDINYTVTETVFEAFYYDPRFKPSFTQKRHKEAGLLGRKSGKGYYDYSEGAITIEPNQDEKLGKYISNRILSMLINEAFDALFMNVASREDIDIAMKFGVNYPKGLLEWADEIGLEKVLMTLSDLFEEYGEDRYRPNPLLKRMVYKN